MPRPKELAPVRWAYDLLNTPFSPRENPLPRPVAGIQDSPYVCVRINLDWLPHLMGFLAAGLQLDAWLGDDDGFSGRQEIHKLLSAMFDLTACVLMTEDTLLRQNPSNKCQLQQSQDGGVTWTLAFDYSLCRSPALDFSTETEINNTYNKWNNTTNNTEINNYAPTTTYRSTTGDSSTRLDARDAALCYAIKTYVDAFCEIRKELNSNGAAAANLVGLALGLVGAGIAIFSAGSGLPAYLALASAATAALAAGGGLISDAVLNDTGAREELACCMYKKIRDLAPNEANFKTSASGGCSPALSANAELIRVGLDGTINQANSGDQFHAFIEILGEGTRLAELGLIDECDLCPPTYDFYFRRNGNGTNQIVGAMFNEEITIIGEANVPSAGNYQAWITGDVANRCYAMNSISITGYTANVPLCSGNTTNCAGTSTSCTVQSNPSAYTSNGSRRQLAFNSTTPFTLKFKVSAIS